MTDQTALPTPGFPETAEQNAERNRALMGVAVSAARAMVGPPPFPDPLTIVAPTWVWDRYQTDVIRSAECAGIDMIYLSDSTDDTPKLVWEAPHV